MVHTFKVGDRVRVTNPDAASTQLGLTQKCGEVEKIFDCVAAVKMDDDRLNSTHGNRILSLKELSLIKEEKMAQQFKVGDRVVTVSSDGFVPFDNGRYNTSSAAAREMYSQRLCLLTEPEPANVTFVCPREGKPTFEGNPVHFKVNRRTGVITVGCQTLSVQSIRNVLARVEAAMVPKEDEVEA